MYMIEVFGSLYSSTSSRYRCAICESARNTGYGTTPVTWMTPSMRRMATI